MSILDARLRRIEELCRKYNGPHVNVGCHELAGKVLTLLTGEEGEGK